MAASNDGVARAVHSMRTSIERLQADLRAVEARVAALEPLEEVPSGLPTWSQVSPEGGELPEGDWRHPWYADKGAAHGVYPPEHTVAGALYLGGSGGETAWRTALMEWLFNTHTVLYHPETLVPARSQQVTDADKAAQTSCASALLVFDTGELNYRAAAELVHLVFNGHPRVMVVWPEGLGPQAYSVDEACINAVGAANTVNMRAVQTAVQGLLRRLLDQYKARFPAQTVEFASLRDAAEYIRGHANALSAPLGAHEFVDLADRRRWYADFAGGVPEIDVVHALVARAALSVAQGADRPLSERAAGMQRQFVDARPRLLDQMDRSRHYYELVALVDAVFAS